MVLSGSLNKVIESSLHRKFGFQKEDEEGRELQGEFFALSNEDRKMFVEHCERFENNFLILESNSYVQDKKRRD